MNIHSLASVASRIAMPEYGASPLHVILQQRKLTALLQPVMDTRNGTIVGYEGLIRGPADSPLHSPFNLFGAAQRYGLSLETEMLSR